MNYSNELKVGSAIVISIVIFIVGSRFFEDIPLFKGTYELYTEFDDARGMIVGNAVRISGVKVGSVKSVDLDPANNKVRISMRLDSKFRVPEGSYTEITGLDVLSAVQLAIHPGPAENPDVEEGAVIPSKADEDVLSSITDRAPLLIDRVDSVLVGLDATLGETQGVVAPGSDLRLMLASLKSSAESLEDILDGEKTRLSTVLANVDTLTGELSRLSSGAGDSLAIISENMNVLLGRVNQNLGQLETTTARLDSIMGKIDRGEGTIGLLVNDPTLYYRMDSTLNNMNQLLVDLKKNPVKYMRALRLVDIF